MIKKILYLIPLFLLFLIPKAYALPNCALTQNAQLYDVFSATSVGGLTTNASYVDGMLCEKVYWAPATSNNSQGLGWNIRLSEIYPKDYNYQITIYMHMEDVGGGVPYIIESPFRNNQISLNDYSPAVDKWVNGVFNLEKFQYNYSSYEQEGSYKYSVITYITKAKINFSYLFVPFATDRLWSGSFWFMGLEIKNLGQSSLTDAEINNLLSQQTTQIQNDLNNLNNSINNKLNSIESGVNNKLDDVNSSIGETNDKLDDVNNSLTDESMPNTSQYGDVAGWLPGGTIDTLINLPLTLFTTLNESASGVCKPYNLPFINNSTITLPCIGDYLTNLNGWGNLISFIDMAMAVILLYKLLMSLYKDIQKLMSLNSSDSDLGGVE